MAGPGGTEVGRISIKVNPDTDGFRRDLQRDLDVIERTMRGTVHINAELDGTGAAAHFAALLQAMRGHTATINVDADTGAAMAQIAALTAVSRLMGGLGGSNGPGGALGAAGGAGPSLAMIGAIAAAVAPALGLVSGLLAGLPSLALAAGAGIGAIALGLDGIKNAAMTLQPEFDNLKETVSDAFQGRLQPIFNELRAVFPVLETGMTSVANGMSDLFQGITNALTSSGGLTQIETILANTGFLFSMMSPAVEKFTSSFLTLGTAGSNAFNHLLMPIQNFATGFDEMVNRVTSNGVFEGAMQGMSQTLDGLLGLFTQLMESGLGAMAELGGPLQTLFGGIGDALVAAMPALTTFSSVVANVLGTALTQLAPTITALTPAFTEFATMFGELATGALTTLGPVLAEVGASLGGAILSTLTALQPVLPTIVESFGTLATTLGGALAEAINVMAPILPELVNSFASLAPMMASTLLPAVQGLAPFLPQIAGAFTQMLGAIVPLLPEFTQLGVAMASNLLPAIVQAAPSMVQLATSIAGLVSAAAPLLGVVTQVAGVLMGVLTQAIANVITTTSGLREAFSAVIDKIAEWVTFATGKAGEFIAIFDGLPGKITSALSGFGTLLVQSGVDLIQGLINGITSMIGSVIDTVSGVASTVVDTISGILDMHSPSRVMKELGGFVAEGFADGITEGTSKVTKAIADMANEATVPDYAQYANSALDIPTDFAKATGAQFLSDIGISGNGALTKLATEGTKYVFNVLSVDEALSIKDREDSKQALSVVGRNMK